MSQPPPPPPGNPPPPPGGGYGYPAQGPGPGPAPSGENPYAQPPPPGQNPYAQAPTQAAFPQQQYPPQGPPPPPPAPGYGGQQPYGQGQLPQGQPQYGYPQQAPGQPPYGTPPPYQVAPGGPGGQQPRNNKTLGIVAAVVAAVLVIGGGVYLATKGGGGGDDPKPKPVASGHNSGQPTHSSTLSYKWSKAADPVAEKDNLKNTVGIWFTDKYVVKNEINKVVGYDQSTGAVAWTIPAPSSGDCSAARDSYNNLAAIQFGADCEQIMVIDMAAGKTAWTANLPSGSGGKPDFDYTEMAISGDTVGVDWMRGSIGYRLSTQKVLWQSGDGNCEDDGYAGGKQFVAVVNCDYKSYEVQVLDTDNNGKAKWSWQAPAGTKVSAIVSTDPVVVLLGSDDATFTDVVTLNAGRLQSRVSLGTDKYDISDDGTEKQAVHNVLVSSDTLYLTLRSNGGASSTAGVAAFSLADGKSKWVAKPADKHDISGLDFSDGKLLAYEPADYELSGALVTIDPATGAISPYATFDDASRDRLDGSSLRNYPVWHNGHFYLATRTVYATDNSQSYLVAFG